MHKPLRKLLATILTLALLVSLLPIGAAPAQAAGEGESTGAFNVTKNTGSSDNAYTYTNGVLTVNNGANIIISMDNDATTPTSDRIVVAENATATITLAGVNIKGSDRDGAQNIAAKSAIDLSNGSILTIDLSANAENTLTGGSGSTDGSGAPGIHVPDSASLIIRGEGNLSVSGGTSNIAWGGVGIGGNAGSGGNAGEACGTVIYFVSDNVKIAAGESAEGNEPADDIGGGKGSQQQNGDDGQGIRPDSDGNYTVYGNLTLPCDITIPQGATVTIPEGASLTVTEGVTLTNGGAITGAGSVTVNGDVSGSGSMSVTGTVTKKEQAAPNAPSSTTDVTDTSVTLSAVTGSDGGGSIEIACDSVTYGETVQPSVTNNTNTGADVTYSYAGTGSTSYGPSSEPPTAAGSYTVTATVAETATHNAAESAPVAFSISKAEQSAPAAPTLASRSSHSLTVNAIAASASGAPAEYSIDGGQTWQRETTFTGLTAATSYEIVARYAETDSHSASPASAALTARTASSHAPSTPERPSGPSTEDSSGWDAILDEIENAENGEITIDMGDETTVPAEIFESLAGKDVEISFDLGNVQWSASGENIPTDADFTDLDLRVDLDTGGIPVNVINTITGEIGTVQITLAHDGEFGFTMTLTAPLGKENAGYWANLYHYDERAEAMNFEAAAKIDQDGSVTIPFTHASQYAIVIDIHSHATVDVSEIFVDVVPNAWYTAAIQYAYDQGLMTGVSANEFAPEATTTRAMIVSILARLEGVTSAQAAGFADVSDEWYATAVNWAANVGVVNGYEDNSFRPNTAITREQLAAILMNYATYKGEEVSARADLTTYTDQPSTWAEETMQWAVAEGLISGVTEDTLQPQGNATRAQVAAILQRFLAQ